NNGYSVICTNNGVCLNNGIGASWNTYTYGLPVWEAIPYDSSNILIVMGNGSYSDGIYKFNLTTHTFNVVEWCYIPTFIKYCTNNNTYYVGTKYDGLLRSSNGISWDTVSYFQGKGCTAMDFYGQHIVISQENNIYAIYYSDNGGISWNQSASNIPLHDISFDQNGILYGVFTGISNSSGLYRSFDYGHTWNMEIFVDNMNTVGFDVVGNLFTGFHGAIAPCQGVAIYDTSANYFTFLNTGLPNKNIHKFKVNPVMSSITIFACTDTGVYYSNNYITSVNNNSFTSNSVHIYPNPANEILEIKSFKDASVEIINTNGQIIEELTSTKPNTTINVSKLSSGIYFIKVKADNEFTIMRFIKL
ncbi:T9SS type A sorting domain-containing protein, partial [Bacteroidota bacterium]